MGVPCLFKVQIDKFSLYPHCVFLLFVLASPVTLSLLICQGLAQFSGQCTAKN